MTRRFLWGFGVVAVLAATEGGSLIAETARFRHELAFQQTGRSSNPQKPNQPPATAPSPSQTPSRGGRGFGPVPGPLPTGQRDFSPWWKDGDVIKEIGLSVDQVNRIDRIYERRRKQIQLHVDELDKQATELNRMFSERSATPEQIELQAQKWMAPRMTIEPSRIRMLYEMSRVMTAEQNQKLQEIAHRRADQFRGRGGSPR